MAQIIHEPLAVEVLAPFLAPAGLARVREWSHARQDYYRLWLLMDAVAERFRGRITLYIVDPLSLKWVFKVVRHRLRRFPAFLIDGGDRYAGWDLAELSRLIERRLGETARGPSGFLL